jgi:hypothetical protein
MPTLTSASRARFFLRLAIAFAFLYPPISAISDPNSWIGYFPRFVLALPIPAVVILHAFGLIEVVIAFWILYGRKVQLPSLAAAALLLGIVVFNFGDIGVLFRDVALAMAALALAFIPEPSNKV